MLQTLNGPYGFRRAIPRVVPSRPPRGVTRSLLGGFGRARMVMLGDVAQDVDQMTGEALDAAYTDEQLLAMDEQYNVDSGSAAVLQDFAADVSANGNGAAAPAVRIGRNTMIGWGILVAGASVASLYHGYRRNNSLGWGLLWGLMGAMFPIVTPAVGIAQGWGKRKSSR